MRTRRQQQAENAQKQTRSNSKKPTKAQLMKQKEKQKQAKKGKQSIDKKQKKQVSVQVKTKVQIKAKVVAKGKKQKEQRVKPSPPKTKSNQKPSKSKDAKNVIKQTEPVKKQVKGKSKDVKEQAKAKEAKAKAQIQEKKIKNKKIEEQKPRKVPQAKKEQQKQNVKTVVMKGKVPIDDHFPYKDQYHVLQHDGKIWSATLNQTNCMNNNNKFYIIQVLQSDSNPQHCYFYTRWGRVGAQGQILNLGVMPISSGIINYNNKLRKKTKKGQYRQIDLNYGNQDEEQNKSTQKKDQNNSVGQQIQKKQSTLPKQVQSLIQLIFDINMMNKQMIQIGYNVNRMPLGKLSKQNMKKGYGILKNLYEQLQKNKRKQVIINLSNDFYSIIPHDFGFSHISLYILDTQQKVKSKIEMLQALAQIKVATTLLSENKDNLNTIDSNYAKLKRQIYPVDRATNQFKTLNDYLQTTHGRHHLSYSLQIVDLFRVQNETESIRYTKQIDNKMLLWHGSRLTNFVGILSQGLRIAPPQAPVTGYMFGKGVYFADMSSKSANYCFTSRDNNTGILLLCQVALGNMNEKIHADMYASNLPPNKHSTKGIGKIQPDPKNAVELQPGVKIPMGPGIQSNDSGIYLRYNQFIVYDIAQIKIKYLFRIKFNYH